MVSKNNHHKEEHWSKPEANKIKVNVDGAIFQSTGSYGVGIVARDSNGQLIEASTILRVGNVQSTTVEAFGIKEALSWIKGKQWSNVVVEARFLVSSSSF
uniref:RNase H type-1 domain-containing protein n=1 Tax=Cannabis sativa TaxID=3483 RepID=A0A803PG17_CANSA